MRRDVASLLKAARDRFAASGSATPALDARLLLQEAAGLTHEDIAAYPERQLGMAEAEGFERFAARRARNEPVSRIIGWREFYGRRFTVTPAVLDPRPDTETLVEAALAIMPQNARLLDLGTGSGAIAITLLAERPDCTGAAVDLSPEALAVAGENAAALGVAARLELLPGSWFEPVQGRFDLILSNPPYIPAGDIAGLASDVKDHDPHLALAGGEDGLDAYRQIAAGSAAFLAPGGAVLVEIGCGQAEAVEGLFKTHGFQLKGRRHDLAGHARCLGFVEETENIHWKSSAAPLNGRR